MHVCVRAYVRACVYCLQTITDDGSFTILSATRSSTASTNLVEAHPQHDEAGSGEDSGHDAEGREPLLRIGPDTQVVRPSTYRDKHLT